MLHAVRKPISDLPVKTSRSEIYDTHLMSLVFLDLKKSHVTVCHMKQLTQRYLKRFKF